MLDTLFNLLENYWTTTADIIHANGLALIERKFENETIKKYSLDTSVIRSSNFTNIVFENVDFSGSHAYDSEFNNCLFDHTSFAKANFINCVFINCKFRNSRFRKFELEKTVFQGCQFENVYWIGSLIEDCTFEENIFNKVYITPEHRIYVCISNSQFQKDGELTLINSEKELIEFFQQMGSFDGADLNYFVN
jgi:uncharacterized protein YjbI with pentapeptide repeats